jgi:hypothetical protein
MQPPQKHKLEVALGAGPIRCSVAILALGATGAGAPCKVVQGVAAPLRGGTGRRSPPERKNGSISLPQSFLVCNSVVDRTLDSLQLPAQEVVVWAAQCRGVQGGAAPLNGSMA